MGLVISSSSLIEADGDDPCLPGGGGAICFGLNAIPERANVEVGISQSSFTRNAAMSGGTVPQPMVNLCFPFFSPKACCAEGNSQADVRIKRKNTNRTFVFGTRTVCSSTGCNSSLVGPYANMIFGAGALFIAADPQSSWVEDCPSMSSTLSSTPCRGLGIRSTTFLDNSAKGAGGAVFMTNAESAFIDTSVSSVDHYKALFTECRCIHKTSKGLMDLF